MRIIRLAIGVLGLVLPLVPAFAADPAVVAQNRQIVAATPEADGVFAVQDDGTVRHKQSGLVCPASFPNLSFYHVFVFAPDGGDVGCDYRRADDNGGAWSKMTIFAVRAPPGTTLDAVFARYHGEIVQTYPDAKLQGPAAGIDEKGAGKPLLPEFRSEEFVITMNGQPYTTQLFVTVVSGWTIEIRSTFVGLPDVIDSAREGPNSALAEAGDRFVGDLALIGAISSVKQP
jgi:hypothetical protein